jgi:ariadne-1
LIGFSQIPATITRILLNHFKWDKEKLMERYYDADQDKLFKEAHVINPFNKPNLICKPKIKKTGTEDCDICFSHFPPTVSV